MINLAGREDCDGYIERELRHAGIPSKPGLPHGEVPYTIIGELHGWTFERAWRYYIVSASDRGLPIELARELWADPCGKEDVRVGGHCGCPSPDEYGADYGFVRSYHVDSVLGLRLLADAIKSLKGQS